MAKPSWTNVNPLSGSGDGTVNIGGSIHTGRVQRTGTITYKATDVTDVQQTVTQTAKAEFVTVNNVSALKEGGNITITGKSNSSRLTFTLGSGNINISLPNSYQAGGATTNNGANITGDPGAAAEYEFSMTVNVPANTTTSAKSRAIAITAAGGQSASSTISQAEGDPYLTVTPKEITIDSAGTAVSVTVTSNTNWTIE